MRLLALAAAVAPASCGCERHTDCPSGEYCDSNGNCFACGFVDGTTCDAMDNAATTMGACCSEVFLHRCPTNPHGCSCTRHADCAPGWYCSDAVPAGAALRCRPCSAEGFATAALYASAVAAAPPVVPASRAACPALGGRCCTADYLSQCPAAPQGCPCTAHGDCVSGMYCASSDTSGRRGARSSGGWCRVCSDGINATRCSSYDGDCCSAPLWHEQCAAASFPRYNSFVPEENPRQDPAECGRRLRWAPCAEGHEPREVCTYVDGSCAPRGHSRRFPSRPARALTARLLRAADGRPGQTICRIDCLPCADGSTSVGGSLPNTCANCPAGRAGEGGLCPHVCAAGEQPNQDGRKRTVCEACQPGRASSDGTWCDCVEGFTLVGQDCHDLRPIRIVPFLWVCAIVAVAGVLLACGFGCAAHDKVESVGSAREALSDPTRECFGLRFAVAAVA